MNTPEQRVINARNARNSRAKRKKERANDPRKAAEYSAFIADRNLKNKERNARVVVAFRTGGCQTCQETTSICLDAHHADPSEKEYQVGTMVLHSYSMKRIATELDKCFCLCKNCHTKVHAGLLDLQSLPKRDWRSQLPEDIRHAL
jgi:uncharacterized Fe-S cluster-containing MiaB family protein